MVSCATQEPGERISPPGGFEPSGYEQVYSGESLDCLVPMLAHTTETRHGTFVTGDAQP